jgi:hypothetical protein
MKNCFKVVLAAAAIFVAANASAQNFSKGDVFLGAKATDLNFGYNFVDEFNQTKFGIGVEGGYFFADKFAADANLGIKYSKNKGLDGTSTFNFGVGLRYYPVGNLYARVGYAGEKETDIDMTSLIKVGVGYDLFLTENWYFEPALYYQKDITKDGSKMNGIGLELGVGLKF